MSFLLKKLTASLILPPTGLIILGFLGLWFARRHPKTGISCTSLALASLLTLSLPPVANSLTASLESYPPITETQLAKVGAIVILGAGTYHAAPEYGTDTVTRHGLERIRYGVRLQKRSGLPILISGGSPYGGRAEADSMKEVIVAEFRGKVTWAETASRNTQENARYSAVILKQAGITHIALVSQVWHLPRAVKAFEAQGLKVTPAPLGYSTPSLSPIASWLPSAGDLANSSEALREWLGRVAQQLTNLLLRNYGNISIIS